MASTFIDVLASRETIYATHFEIICLLTSLSPSLSLSLSLGGLQLRTARRERDLAPIFFIKLERGHA